MSRTRELVSDLRRRLGASDPLPAAPPVPVIERPPTRVTPQGPVKTPGFAEKAAKHTTALVGIGHVGTRYATDVVLQFQAELAVAHEAVGTELPEGWAEQHGFLGLKTRVSGHREFLLRPDLGRRLDDDSLELLRSRGERNPDVQIILADGLSAVATMKTGEALVSLVRSECQGRGWKVGTPICARYARVWLEDEIGQEVGARAAVIILGERPGLGTGDGLSAYLVYEPRIGKTDGDRNMMSNIHQRGTPPEQAAKRIATLLAAMFEQGKSGVALELAGNPELAASVTGYRAPQVRERLVEKL